MNDFYKHNKYFTATLSTETGVAKTQHFFKMDISTNLNIHSACYGS